MNYAAFAQVVNTRLELSDGEPDGTVLYNILCETYPKLAREIRKQPGVNPEGSKHIARSLDWLAQQWGDGPSAKVARPREQRRVIPNWQNPKVLCEDEDGNMVVAFTGQDLVTFGNLGGGCSADHIHSVYLGLELIGCVIDKEGRKVSSPFHFVTDAEAKSTGPMTPPHIELACPCMDGVDASTTGFPEYRRGRSYVARGKDKVVVDGVLYYVVTNSGHTLFAEWYATILAAANRPAATRVYRRDAYGRFA